MSLTPDWAPNIHPLVIHFPIALLVTAAMTDLAGILLRDRTSVRDAASLLYTAGAVCAVVAYFTGHHAEETVLLPAMANVLVNEHADWAFRATWFFVFFASIRLALSFIIRVPGYTATLVSFAAGFVGLYLLFETAERAGGSCSSTAWVFRRLARRRRSARPPRTTRSVENSSTRKPGCSPARSRRGEAAVNRGAAWSEEDPD